MKTREMIHWVINELFAQAPARAFHEHAAALWQEQQFPDVSFYQQQIDWDIMRKKTDAVIIRAGQGIVIDIQFRRNWAEAKRVGLKRGVYWFYDDRMDPGRQADLLVSLIGNDRPEMEVWCDWENTYGGAFGGLKNVVAFMQAVEAKLPVKVGMYTGYYWFRSHSNVITNAGQYAYLKAHPLWLAWYTADPALVLIPQPWASLRLWQYGTPAVGLAYGVQTKEIDMSYFNGTVNDFNVLYGESSAPTGGSMPSQWYRVNTTALNIRSGPGTSYSDIGDLYKDERIEVIDQPMGGWVKIATILRVSGATEKPNTSWCRDSYLVKIDPPIVTPPSPTPVIYPDYVDAHFPDGSTKRYVPE
jgi:GH25 family lysozyme M1 (1,4-beta-N-acetylmuramidase)